MGALRAVLVLSAVLEYPSTTVSPTGIPSPLPAMALATQVTASTGTAVPASIDATGSSDASAALNAFIGTVPDGSTIVFKAGGIYRLDQNILLVNRHNLIFEGNGATLRANGPAATQASPFRLNSGNSGIVIRYFTIVGNNPNTTTLYTTGSEDQMGVLIYGSTNIEIAHNTISHTWGDGVYVGPNVNTHASSDGIWVHDNTFSYIGRMGIAVVDGSNITVERNSFGKVGLHVFDIEPDTAWEVTAFATFRNNTVGSYGLSDKYTGYFFAADGAAGSTVHDVTVTGNTVTGGSLLTIVHLARRQNVVFTNNTSTVRATGPVLRFAHVDGLTVTGNVQPLTSGGLARITDSTGVTGP